jgi:hypothetical protein
MGFLAGLSGLRSGKRIADVNARLAKDLAREYAGGDGKVEFALLQVLGKITQDYFEDLKLPEDDPRRMAAAETLSAIVEVGIHVPVSQETYDTLLGEMSSRGIAMR